jgi:hypothetical protein
MGLLDNVIRTAGQRDDQGSNFCSASLEESQSHGIFTAYDVAAYASSSACIAASPPRTAWV